MTDPRDSAERMGQSAGWRVTRDLGNGRRPWLIVPVADAATMDAAIAKVAPLLDLIEWNYDAHEGVASGPPLGFEPIFVLGGTTHYRSANGESVCCGAKTTCPTCGGFLHHTWADPQTYLVRCEDCGNTAAPAIA